jgi:hypothetical protein
MGKKTKRKQQTAILDQNKPEEDISPIVEEKFKRLLRIMSWTVGICFLVIIILPNFEFFLLDITIKLVYYIGVLNLLLFIFLEFFGTNVKRFMSKHIS